jgi:hypothetical protein
MNELSPAMVHTYSIYQSLLFAWVFWITVTLGCLGITFLHHTVKAVWGYPVLRIAEAGSKTFLPMIVLYLIIFFLGKEHLYFWTHPNHDPELVHKMKYMGWIVPRTIFYFLVLGGLSWLVNRSSRREDQSGDIRERNLRTNISSPGIVFFILVLTFAFTDWVMSLSPKWSSTIYGFLFMADSGLVGLAFVTLVAVYGIKNEAYKRTITPVVTRDLGNLMLTFTMVWAYFNISQFLIQWSGNLPEEIRYYWIRDNDYWRAMGAFLIFGQFFLPLVLLFSGRAKRTPHLLAKVAGWIFFVRVIDIYWIVIPNFREGGPAGQGGNVVLDILVWAVMGAFWMAGFWALLKQNTLLPRHEPFVPQEVLEHA